MELNTLGIVLHYIKHSENSIIAYIYTENAGRQTFMVKGVGKTRNNKHRNILQPLSLVEITYHHKEKNEMQFAKNIKLHLPYQTIPFDIIKSTIAIFLSEVLYRTIKEHEKNTTLFDYIYHSLHLFDLTNKGVANFHLFFLTHLTRYVGIYPKTNYSEQNNQFNINTGTFSANGDHTQIFFTPTESKIFADILNTNLSEMDFIKTDSNTRYNLLKKILNYYSHHLNGIKEIKSLAILTDVFTQ